MRQTETPFTSLRRLRHLPVLEEFHPFALSLILGFLIGVEREYHHKKSATAFGVRTFPFVALTGTLAAYAHNTYLTLVIAGAVFALIVISYFSPPAGAAKLQILASRRSSQPSLFFARVTFSSITRAWVHSWVSQRWRFWSRANGCTALSAKN